MALRGNGPEANICAKVPMVNYGLPFWNSPLSFVEAQSDPKAAPPSFYGSAMKLKEKPSRWTGAQAIRMNE